MTSEGQADNHGRPAPLNREKAQRMASPPLKKIVVKTPLKKVVSQATKSSPSKNSNSDLKRPRSTKPLRSFSTEYGLPSVEKLADEIEEMMSVLKGDVDPPIQMGVITMMEVADAYHARAADINMKILRLQREGVIKSGDQLYRFRTGELRQFIDVASKATALGSRRLTYAQVLLDSERTGRQQMGGDDDD